MEFFDNCYFRVGKNFSRSIGRWPYQQRWESKICGFIVVFLCTSQFYAEVVGVIVYSNDKEVVFEAIVPFMIDILVAAKYINAVINVKTMIMLLERLKEHWSIYTREEEICILHKYAHIGKLVIYGYTGLVYVTTALFVTEPLIPKFINYILQLNETVPYKYPVPIYWHFTNMEENFYPIWSYESLCIVAILTITVANDSLFILLLQHACALFTIVGARLKNIPSGNDLKKYWADIEELRKTDDIQHDYYVMCIKNHQDAIRFAELLEDMYVWCFGVVITTSMMSLSVTTVQLATQADSIQKIMKYSMFTSAQLIHLFFFCYLSQHLTDCSSDVQEYIILSNWYGLSRKTKKLISMVIMQTQVPCTLSAGKIVCLSLQMYAVIVKTSASYFTVMISMQ